MDLRALGLDPWFDDKLSACTSGLSIARVTAVDRSRFVIRDEQGERRAGLTGNLKFAATSPLDLPCVGDWVCASSRDARAAATIHAVLPRRTSLRRKVAGKDIDYQVVAANVDVALLVQSCHFDFSLRRLERYLVMVREGGIEPILLLTKTDLVDDVGLASLVDSIRLAGAAVRIVPISNLTGTGLEQVRELLRPGKTYCLLGSSGVGKTTLLNRLISGKALATGTVSHTGEGRHTTTRRQLLELEGGALLIDMPGMRELGLLGASDGLEATFTDVAALSRSCRYANCAHRDEPGCAVRAAIERRELSEDRLQSYQKLVKESAFHERSLGERRARDRAFGRLLRSLTKDGGKRGRT